MSERELPGRYPGKGLIHNLEPEDMTSANLASLGLSLGLAVSSMACLSEDQAFVSYTFFAEPGFSPETIVLEASDGSRVWQVTGDDFDRRGNRGDTREFSTRTTGELVTSFWLVLDSDTLSAGQLSVDLRKDWRWNISLQRAARDPTTTCLGCSGKASFELAPVLRTVPADSLWLVWGGNSISNPAVFQTRRP